MPTQLTMLDDAPLTVSKVLTEAGGFTPEAIALTPEVSALLAANAPVAIGVSGGKDGAACAFATTAHLDAIGHTGPRLLLHADLGRVEWQDSLPACRRLSDALGVELVVVRRKAGGLMERWLTRWENNVARYASLECVKLILPWSTASMRFCTSELKTAVICRELTQRFPGRAILNAVGIRREESSGRAKAPVAAPQPRLTVVTKGTSGLNWHPVIDWAKTDVLAYLRSQEFPLHEAYTRYGSSRVSCCFCILGAKADLRAAATCEANHDLYREMVGLEVASTFSFQDSGWLGDVAPHLLTPELVGDLARAKKEATVREAAESRIPKHLLYVKGWPTCVPTQAEAELLCAVRETVSCAIGIGIGYTEPAALIARYEELMAAKRSAALN